MCGFRYRFNNNYIKDDYYEHVGGTLVIATCMKLHNLILDKTNGRGYGRHVEPKDVCEYEETHHLNG